MSKPTLKEELRKEYEERWGEFTFMDLRPYFLTEKEEEIGKWWLSSLSEKLIARLEEEKTELSPNDWDASINHAISIIRNELEK